MQEKPGTKISTKSWHFRLMKLVLGSAAPTPSNMHNLCPYFWLVIASILISPIVLPFKLLFKLGDYLNNKLTQFFDKFVFEPAATSWEESLTDTDVFLIHELQKKINRSYKRLNSYYDDGLRSTRRDFAQRWWLKNRNNGEFDLRKWSDWQRECRTTLHDAGHTSFTPKQPSKFSKWLDRFGQKVLTLFDNIGDSLKSWTNIIKWTKRFVGLLITVAGLFVTYYVVNFGGRGVLWIVEIWNWMYVAGGAGFIVFLGFVWGLVYLIKMWIDLISEKGTKLWYVKITYYPLKYIIFIPIYFIFFQFLWKFVILNMIYLTVSVAKLVWSGILGFLGIFGEYFGASYTDMCPGIEITED